MGDLPASNGEFPIQYSFHYKLNFCQTAIQNGPRQFSPSSIWINGDMLKQKQLDPGNQANKFCLIFSPGGFYHRKPIYRRGELPIEDFNHPFSRNRFVTSVSESAW